MNLRVASPGGASMHVGFNNASNVWRVVSIPNTGGWQNWTTVSFTATLGAGTQQITLLFDTAGLNIESIGVTATASSPGPPPPPPSSTGGGVVTVNAGGDLQAAINNAQPGDTIVLQAGATFTGNFVLPDKSGSAYVTITSSGDRSRLPGDDTRIDPSYSPLLAKIQSPNSGPAIATAPFAHHYQLQLLEFLPNFQGYYDVLQLGDGNQTSLAVVPHDLIVDRVLHSRRPDVRAEARHLPEHRVDDDQELVHRRHRRREHGHAGDLRVERAGTVHDREQLP